MDAPGQHSSDQPQPGQIEPGPRVVPAPPYQHVHPLVQYVRPAIVAVVVLLLGLATLAVITVLGLYGPSKTTGLADTNSPSTTLGSTSAGGSRVYSAAFDDEYIDVLRDRQIPVASRADAIRTAHQYCDMLSDDVAPLVIVGQSARTTGLSPQDTAFAFGAAVAAYCPQYRNRASTY